MNAIPRGNETRGWKAPKSYRLTPTGGPFMGLVGIPTKRAARVCVWKGACVRAHARVCKAGTKRFNTCKSLGFYFPNF